MFGEAAVGVIAYMWTSEDKLRESVLSFITWVLGMELKSSVLDISPAQYVTFKDRLFKGRSSWSLEGNHMAFTQHQRDGHTGSKTSLTPCSKSKKKL